MKILFAFLILIASASAHTIYTDAYYTSNYGYYNSNYDYRNNYYSNCYDGYRSYESDICIGSGCSYYSGYQHRYADYPYAYDNYQSRNYYGQNYYGNSQCGRYVYQFDDFERYAQNNY